MLTSWQEPETQRASELMQGSAKHATAVLVNPNDRLGVAEAIVRACRMDPAEQRRRMRRMREVVRDQDVFFWAESFLGRLARLDAEPAHLATGS